MSANVSFVDQSQWQAAVRELLAKVPKPITETLNTQSFYIARAAHRGTPRASREGIEKAMGVVGYNVSKSKKTGQFKRRKAIFGNARNQQVPRAALIVNARRGRAGKPGLKGKEMLRAIQKMVGKRVRAVGTEAAGWLRIIRTYGAAIGKPGEGGKVVKGKGSATPAKDGWSPRAEFVYDLNSYDTKHKQYIDPRTVDEVQNAFNEEAGKTMDYLQKKLQPVFNQHNGRP